MSTEQNRITISGDKIDALTFHQTGRQVVWKFPLELVAGPQKITAPRDSRLVHFAMQRDVPTVWMLVDENQQDTAEHWFQIKGTGDPAGRHHEAVYVGTTQHGLFVWHLFLLLGAGPFGHQS